jgi:diguanylate cyclase (GGDEF)-like protein|tara:strand:+ start:1647 stop:3641 length:1995 start_codon:yes stop_codon:yes gene_type:complete
MSLLKQLLLSVTLVVAGILAGTLFVSLDTARQYLNDELQAQSRNAASTLALLMSQPGNQDRATRELLVTALFDSGQFEQIVFTPTAENDVFRLELDRASQPKAVPDWFSGLVTLNAKAQVREVTDGWQRIGTISVMADDQYALQSLWNSVFRLLFIVIGVGIIWALFAIILVRWFRRALKREITTQLDAISANGQSTPMITEAAESNFSELHDVSDAIGQARERIKATQAELDSRIESLELELNRDPITGLANRKYFVNDLRRRMEKHARGAAVEGHILLFRQRDLAAINRALSRVQVDEWLKTVGERVLAAVKQFPDIPCVLARLNGSDFVLLMLTSSSLDAIRLAQHVRKTLTQLQVTLREGGVSRWAYALIDAGQYGDVSTVLSALDHALMRAESSGHKDIEYVAQPMQVLESKAAPSESEWSELIGHALEHDGLVLSYTHRLYHNELGEIKRYEALLILLDQSREGTAIPGFLFMPAAQRLGYSSQCDLKAIQLALTWLTDNPEELVLRVSLASLLHGKFTPTVVDLLHAAPANVVSRLCLEVDAFALVSGSAEVQAFCRDVVACGVKVGLRNLGNQPEALIYLHQAPFSYLKIGGDFVAGVLGSPGSQNLLGAVIQTARKLKISVLADDVPDQGTANLLMRQGIYLERSEQDAKPESNV